jgi:hypothetical protein
VCINPEWAKGQGLNHKTCIGSLFLTDQTHSLPNLEPHVLRKYIKPKPSLFVVIYVGNMAVESEAERILGGVGVGRNF